MEARIALGATLDIASSEELDDAKSEILGEFRKPLPKPNFGVRTEAGLMPASGALVLDLGSPPAGRLWNILAITTYGDDDATTVANARVALYTGNPDNVGLADLLVPALVVPTYADFAHGVLWCYSSENLVCRVTSAAANVQVGVNIQVAEWKEVDKLARSGK